MNRTNADRLEARTREYALKLVVASAHGPVRLRRAQVLPEVRAEVFEAYRTANGTDGTDACLYCSRTTTLGVDFLVPSSRDGNAHPDNLVPACEACRHERRGRHLDDFLEHRLDLDPHAVYARIARATQHMRRLSTFIEPRKAA